MSHLESSMQAGPRPFTGAKAVLAGALMIAGLAVTAPAQAHTLSESQAEGVSARHAQKVVGSANNDYISYDVVFCRSVFPHIVECRIGFDNPATKYTSRYACAERIQVFYKAHSEIPQSTPRKFYKHITHEC
jgi:hypothetical protein